MFSRYAKAFCYNFFVTVFIKKQRTSTIYSVEVLCFLEQEINEKTYILKIV